MSRGSGWKRQRLLHREAPETRDKRVSKLLSAMLRRGHQIQRFSEYHYRVDNLIDWWPCTGKWRTVNGNRSGVGDSIYQALEG